MGGFNGSTWRTRWEQDRTSISMDWFNGKSAGNALIVEMKSGSQRPVTDRIKKLLEIMMIQREGHGKRSPHETTTFDHRDGWPKAQPEMAPEMERHSAALKNAPNASAENDRFPREGCGKVMFAIARWSWDVQGGDSVRLSNQPVIFVLVKNAAPQVENCQPENIFWILPVLAESSQLWHNGPLQEGTFQVLDNYVGNGTRLIELNIWFFSGHRSRTYSWSNTKVVS